MRHGGKFEDVKSVLNLCIPRLFISKVTHSSKKLFHYLLSNWLLQDIIIVNRVQVSLGITYDIFTKCYF